jgi:hypothetical protein
LSTTQNAVIFCETSKPTKWVIMAELRWCESPGNAARIAALSDDQAPTAITGCPHVTAWTSLSALGGCFFIGNALGGDLRSDEAG